jgi:hypothetical protein
MTQPIRQIVGTSELGQGIMGVARA